MSKHNVVELAGREKIRDELTDLIILKAPGETDSTGSGIWRNQMSFFRHLSAPVMDRG